jgi:hypothetical protein
MTARSGAPPGEERRHLGHRPEAPPQIAQPPDQDDTVSLAHKPSTYGLSVDELLAEASRLIDNGWSAEEIRQVLAFDGES